MLIGFVIWTVIGIMLLGIGIWALVSKEAVGFWTGVKPPKVTDVKKYNRAVGILWIVYAILYELLGIPILFLKQNSAGFVPVILGTVVITIGLAVAYAMIEKKYKA